MHQSEAIIGGGREEAWASGGGALVIWKWRGNRQGAEVDVRSRLLVLERLELDGVDAHDEQLRSEESK